MKLAQTTRKPEIRFVQKEGPGGKVKNSATKAGGLEAGGGAKLGPLGATGGKITGK